MSALYMRLYPCLVLCPTFLLLCSRLAQVASQTWQPQALQLHYNRVLQATPIDSQWRLTALEQELKVSQLRISSIENSMAIRRSQLRRDEPRLKALTSL